MVLQVSFEGVARIDSLGRRLNRATEQAALDLTDVLYMKVLENVSGKILQKRSGELASSIRQETLINDGVYTSTVWVEPESDKAWALEKGGKGFYVIEATKATVLRFVTKSGDRVFAKSVNHPPSQKFAYLETALMETEPLVPEKFRDYIQAVFDGEGE